MVRFLLWKEYAVSMLHKMISKYIAHHFDFQKGCLFRLYNLDKNCTSTIYMQYSFEDIIIDCKRNLKFKSVENYIWLLLAIYNRIKDGSDMGRL